MPTPQRSPAVPADAFSVETKSAAALFGHPGRRRILFAFAGSDRSLSEVAALVGMPMNLLHYHVQRMLSAGLLRPRGRVARAGRPVLLYRAAASAFFVPAALLPASPDARLHRELRKAIERSDQNTDGFVFSTDAEGRVLMRKVGGDGAHELWRRVSLEEAAARKLIEEMGALIQTYQRAAGRRARRYVIRVAVARSEG